MTDKRLYVLVRNDLPPGLQLAQACHAAFEFARRFPGVDVGDNLVALQTDAAQLQATCAAAELRGVHVQPFFEPDLSGSLTAAALDGGARPLVSTFPLALRTR